MNRNAPRFSGVLGVVHRAGRDWRVLLVDASGSTPRVTAAEVVASGSPERVHELLESGKADRVLQVVPASASVCRTCALPDAEGEALDAALRLQAETWLLAGSPPHRTGTGVLPPATAETGRTGIVTSWPETAEVDEAPSPAPVRWVPEPVALAALLDAERPAEPLLSVDRSRGSVGLALCDPGGVSVRSTHAAVDAADWRAAIERVIVETALGGDHTPGFAKRIAEQATTELGGLDATDAATVLPPDVTAAAGRRLQDAGGDAAWWRTFGIAAGAALAATGPFAEAATLERAVAETRVTLASRVAEAIARPRVAAMTAVACLVLLAIMPLVTSGLRRAVLQARHGDVEAAATDVTRAETHLAMYAALEDRAWSMTKLLGDIAANTPGGITFTSLTVSLDNESISARGEAIGRDGAEAPDRLLLMQQQLGETDGLFGSVTLNWEKENNFGAYSFRLDAAIDRPFVRPDYDVERDYGRWTEWMRQRNMPPPSEDEAADDEEAGDEGDGTTMLAGGSDDSSGASGIGATTRPGTTSTSRPSRPSGSGAARAAERSGAEPAGGGAALTDIPRAGDSSRPGGASRDRGDRNRIGQSGDGLSGDSSEVRLGGDAGAVSVPEPLTEEQIASFDKPQVLDFMSRISKVRPRLNRDDPEQEEVHQRLTNEFRLLTARLREIGRDGGGS